MSKRIDAIYEQVLLELSIFWRQHHTPPTVRQLCERLNIGSTSQVLQALDLATERNEVRRDNFKYIPKWVDEMFDKDSS